MHVAGSPDVDHLSDYERRYSRRGLLIRYARGRVKNFASRQIMTFAGGFVLAMTEGLRTASLAVIVALLGEVIDCLYLNRLPERLRNGYGYRRLLIGSTLTAFVQALTISYCVWLAWTGARSGVSPLFIGSFLAGAAINAGLVLPFHRPAAVARLAVYAGITQYLFLIEAIKPGRAGDALFLNAAGAVMLAFMVGLFLNFVNWGFRQHRRTTLDLIEQGRDLVRHQKEAQLLSLVAKNANDSVILADADGRIVWTNETFTRITGYSVDEAKGFYPGDLLNGEKTDLEVSNAIAEAVEAGRPFRTEILNVSKDGREIWMETNLVPVLDKNGRVEVTVAIERDVTAAKAQAEELAAARIAAEEGARAKAEFLATMSHEIRTPMNGVVGMAELLSDTELSEEQRQYVSTIRSSSTALLAIINDVLELSRLDARKMELHPVNFDPKACLEETLRLLQPQARAKGLKLALETETDVPPLVHGDDGRLRQVLINLLGNAIKFTERGGVTLRVRADAQEPGHLFVIVVEDSGIGIAADKIERVFERFSQADTDTTRLYGGTGLGLTISRELVVLMGGRITVESTLGQGSCFTLRLPLGPPGDPGADADTQTLSPDELDRLRGLSVLVADDNRVNRLLMGKFLADLPIRLDFAHDGQQAVAMATRQEPDIVFMDMSMPVMSGIEATSQIRASKGAQPLIVALTANTFDSDRAACLAAGMDDFLSKPVGRADLFRCLLNHLPPRDATRMKASG
ncbi:ATP-binding protein [Ruegeria sp. 1NDH52C]|uniref:histidine kinase n=1 Tax=Ruegeria alba TaxID=2916756 RepID=A0ABS9NWF0_9RHOB|nr:ATP-binding protein [Ruegeria alba]MCG6558533.1 ATP-binding protein [Ruegeria alba]